MYNGFLQLVEKRWLLELGISVHPLSGRMENGLNLTKWGQMTVLPMRYFVLGSSTAPTSCGSVLTFTFCMQGDTPNEKRPKLGSHVVDVKGKDKMSKGIGAVESAKPDEMTLLNLAENDKVFNIGKSSKNENKFDAHRMVRTGLQKEGSKVIFGVPKPGKKRKFMEVSKHYVAHENSKIGDRNDSVKLTNFLMPPSSGPRGWKNSSKNDAKEKHGADSKPKTSKYGKSACVLFWVE